METEKGEVLEGEEVEESSAILSSTTPTLSPDGEKQALCKGRIIDLGEGSEVVYYPRFIGFDESWKWLDYINKHIPWKRPTIRVFGRSCLQPRDTCYIASAVLPDLIYSGYQPHAYTWDEFPLLKQLLDAVHRALPGSNFNSLLLNRYKGGTDYVGWHSDNEKLYGSMPEIASVSFGCERDFILKKKPGRKAYEDTGRRHGNTPPSKRLKISEYSDQHCLNLKHGSLLVMRGYTQRDWLHSVPKRAKVDALRINLTFRRVL